MQLSILSILTFLSTISAWYRIRWKKIEPLQKGVIDITVSPKERLDPFKKEVLDMTIPYKEIRPLQKGGPRYDCITYREIGPLQKVS